MGVCWSDRLQLATVGCKDVGESGFEVFESGPNKESASHNGGAQWERLLITDGFPALENRGPKDIKCVREERKACHYHRQKQCSNLACHAFLLN